jgi:hypothetical protein
LEEMHNRRSAARYGERWKRVQMPIKLVLEEEEIQRM